MQMPLGWLVTDNPGTRKVRHFRGLHLALGQTTEIGLLRRLTDFLLIAKALNIDPLALLQ